MKYGSVFEALIVGIVVIFTLMLIPRLLNSIAANNARLAAQTSPGAAADSVWARFIGSAGDVGVGLIDKYGDSLLNQGN